MRVSKDARRATRVYSQERVAQAKNYFLGGPPGALAGAAGAAGAPAAPGPAGAAPGVGATAPGAPATFAFLSPE